MTVGGDFEIDLNNITMTLDVGPAGGVGGGVAVLGGSCKLVLGGKKCKDCNTKK